MEKDKDLALAFPDYYLINEKGEIYSEIKRFNLSKQENLISTPPNGACMMIRKKILKRIRKGEEENKQKDEEKKEINLGKY